jgi:hypothetical protein
MRGSNAGVEPWIGGWLFWVVPQFEMKEAANWGGLASDCSAEGYFLHAFDDEHTRLRCFDAGCVNLFLGWRIVPGLCFLCAVEGNDDESLRRSSIEGGYFIGAGDVATTEFLKNRRGSFIRSLAEGFEALRVSYLANVNDSIDWRFGLGMKTLDGCGSNCDTREQG